MHIMGREEGGAGLVVAKLKELVRKTTLKKPAILA